MFLLSVISHFTFHYHKSLTVMNEVIWLCVFRRCSTFYQRGGFVFKTLFLLVSPFVFSKFEEKKNSKKISVSNIELIFSLSLSFWDVEKCCRKKSKDSDFSIARGKNWIEWFFCCCVDHSLFLSFGEDVLSDEKEFFFKEQRDHPDRVKWNFVRR